MSVLLNSPAPAPGTRAGTAPAPASSYGALIPQPDALRLPIRVPVTADCGGTFLQAEVLGSSAGVLLLEAVDQDGPLPSLGTPIRIRSDWDRRTLTGRIAAHGVAARFLVSLGERAIRRSRRVPVDLPGVARSAHLARPTEVRVVDLSAGGARVIGIDLPVGTEVSLFFTPPSRSEPLTVSGFVVRAIEGEQPSLGVAFRLVQQSMDLLGRPDPAEA